MAPACEAACAAWACQGRQAQRPCQAYPMCSRDGRAHYGNATPARCIRMHQRKRLENTSPARRLRWFSTLLRCIKTDTKSVRARPGGKRALRGNARRRSQPWRHAIASAGNPGQSLPWRSQDVISFQIAIMTRSVLKCAGTSAFGNLYRIADVPIGEPACQLRAPCSNVCPFSPLSRKQATNRSFLRMSNVGHV